MGQILKQDKIGALSHNAGIITLPASTLTIGGQQYVTSSLTRTIATDVTMTANTRYQIYAVVSGGVIVLRISSNENSVGPSGFTAWKLVGCFRSNGLVTPAFGSFVNITGIPRSEDIEYTPTFTNYGTVTAISMYYRTFGKVCEVYGKFTQGTGSAAEARIGLPFTLESTSYIPSIRQAGTIQYLVATNIVGWLNSSASLAYLTVSFSVAGNNAATLANGNSTVASTIHSIAASTMPMVELSNTPIEDR